jgi:hypothetical protein
MFQNSLMLDRVELDNFAKAHNLGFAKRLVSQELVQLRQLWIDASNILRGKSP